MMRFSPSNLERARMRKQLNISAEEVLFGIVASLNFSKNHSQLIDAVARLIANDKPVRLLIVGNGPTRPDLERQVTKFGIDARVTFAGIHADVRPWLCACDVGVICSVAVETFSLAALEYLACGVPMVMSDIGGASEIVQDGFNGLLVPAGNVDALTDALDRMINASTREHFAAGARASVGKLTLSHMLDRYAELVTTMVSPSL